MLNENYHGEIYHFTSLIQASWIVDDDCISSHIAMSDECGRGYREDDRKYVDSETPFISFTRDKNYHIQGNNSTIVCFIFDGDSIQNIRNARLYPYAYNTDNRGESEERIYGVDIYPLHKYLKRIEIKVSDKEFSWASDRDYDEEGELYDEFSERFPDLNDLEISRKISDYLISKITNNKLFSDKVIIHNKINCNINMNKKMIRLTEQNLHRIVKESVSKVLNEAYGTPDARTKKEIDGINNSKESLKLPLGEPFPERQKGRGYTRNTVYKDNIDYIANSARNIAQACSTLKKNWRSTDPLSNINRFLEKISAHTEKIIGICDMAYNKITMINGEQPQL